METGRKPESEPSLDLVSTKGCVRMPKVVSPGDDGSEEAESVTEKKTLRSWFISQR